MADDINPYIYIFRDSVGDDVRLVGATSITVDEDV